MTNGFIASSFDLLHAGHLLMLKECRENCSHLYIGLHTDPTIDRPEKNRPIQSYFERWLQLSSCIFASGATIIPYETEDDLYAILTTYPIDVRFLGADYKHNHTFTGANLPIKIHYCSRDHHFSSSGLRKKIYDANVSKTPKPYLYEGLDHIANFLNSLDTEGMSANDVRSRIYKECMDPS